MKKYDVIIVGGGTSGVAAAYTSAKLGLKTLIIEKNIHLGGTMTSALVTPIMKIDMENINTDFYIDLIDFAKKYGAQHTYSDGNSGWLNPHLLKIVFDDMLSSVNCEILYNSEFISGKKLENDNFQVEIISNMLSLQFETKYLVDATGFGKVAKIFNCNFLNSENSNQATTLRFIMSNIDMETFENWLLKYDSDRNITTSDKTSEQIHLSTAYTWDTNIKWALKPLFAVAIANDILKEEDSAYFQIFTIPGMPGSIAFNCPRILIDDNESINDPETYSKALIQARSAIYRLSVFCNKYLPGFENAYISSIADMLGVRESGRVEGKYVFTDEDIIQKTKFENTALSSNYPIDIHSKEKNASVLDHPKGNYYLPIESLISKDYDNLYIIGRHLSATFKAQAAIRTQSNCFSMGEAVAKHIKSKEL